MGEPRLSTIIIGILLVGVISTGFMGFLGAGADKYQPSTYDNTTFATYTQVSNNAQQLAIATKNETDSLGASPGDNDFDIFGSLFSSAWTAIKTTDDSMDQLANISAQAQKDTGRLFFPGFSRQLFGTIAAIITIIIVIAVLLHFIAKSNRL